MGNKCCKHGKTILLSFLVLVSLLNFSGAFDLLVEIPVLLDFSVVSLVTFTPMVGLNYILPLSWNCRHFRWSQNNTFIVISCYNRQLWFVEWYHEVNYSSTVLECWIICTEDIHSWASDWLLSIDALDQYSWSTLDWLIDTYKLTLHQNLGWHVIDPRSTSLSGIN